MASGQDPASGTESRVKAPAFEVVSIRPSKPGTSFRVGVSITPDGYSVQGQTLFTTIMLAYFPQRISFPPSLSAYWSKGRLSGAPAWLSEQYDIQARVSDADRAEWQKQGPRLDQKPMLSAMLQTMLADRCHLVAHMTPVTIPGWSLQLGKHAPHVTESKPGEELPVGVKLPDGGVVVPYQPGDKPRLTIYAATVADLAGILSGYAGSPVQDYTGLAGHYDLTVDFIPYPDSKIPVVYRDPNDTDPLARWNLDSLGLRYAPIEIPAQTLVIDHIEKPSEN